MRRDDDVIVLTETSRGAGTRLIVEGLTSRGYFTIATALENDRGTLIATRLEIRRNLSSLLNVTLPWRVAAIELAGDLPIAFLGVYVPSRDRSPMKVLRKRSFIRSLLESVARLPRSIRDHMIIAGDYNVISRRHDPPRLGFFAYEYEMLESLEAFGFSAGHELANLSKHPHSWIGRTGAGYLYDYFHIAERLQPHVAYCEYLHRTRHLRLSDHAAVSVSFRFR